MFKRVWYYVTRKRVKTFLMFFLLFGIAALMISGLAIRKATTATREKVDQSIGTSFTVSNNMEFNLGTSRGGTVPKELIEKISKVKGVTRTVRRMNGAARLVNAELVDKPEAYGPYAEETPEEYRNVLVFNGTDHSDMDSLFRMESIRLSQGRHIQEGDTYKALVHETFAKENHLKIGDKLIFEPFEEDEDNRNPSKEPVEMEIIGLFTGENASPVAYASELFENIIMTDLQTIWKLYGETEETAVYNRATFFTANADEMKAAMEEAEKSWSDWKNYKLLANEREYQVLRKSANTLEKMVNGLLIGTFLISAGIIVLVLFLWMRGRRKETGILMALGVSKVQIVFQYILELALIAIISLFLSFFTGKAMANSIGNLLVQKSSQNVTSAASAQMSFMLGADADSSALVKTIDEIQVTVEPMDLVIVAGVEFGVILFGILLSCTPMLKMKPKEILSQMS